MNSLTPWPPYNKAVMSHGQSMLGRDTNLAEARLTLSSQLTQLTLVWSWVEALAAQYSISEKTRYAIHLCLEEALSNVIRHGYCSESNHTVTIEFKAIGNTQLTFAIEDHAPPFDPTSPEVIGAAPVPSSILDLQSGGVGIRLLRQFSDSLIYERLSDGNRMTICFLIV